MALTVVSLFGSRSAPMPQSDLHAAFSAVTTLAPSGSRVEARALDRTFLEVHHPLGQPPQVKLDSGDLPHPIAAAAATIWLDDMLDNIELAARETMVELHARLSAVATGVFDTRRHLDLVGRGEMPRLQAMAVVERRESMDRDSFIQYYRTHHVPLAKSLSPRFVRYTTFRLLEKVGDFVGDCITLQEYPSLEELRTHLTTRTAQGDTAGDDSGNFISHLIYNIGERTLY